MFEKITEEQIKTLFKDRPENSNKGDFGYVALIGGSLKYSGAIRLANMSCCAMGSGAGVATVVVPKCICTSIAEQILESTLLPLDCTEEGFISGSDECLSQIGSLFEKYKAIAFGMGIGNESGTSAVLEYILRNYSGRLVIDADGINALAKMIEQSSDAILDSKIGLKTNAKVVLTPHLMEFARIYGASLKSGLIKDCTINPNDFETLSALQNAVLKQAKTCGPDMAISLAKLLKCVVILKGNKNYITDGNISYMADKGCPGMATAGSGDVLSGILAGILGYNDDLVLSAAGAAYINGLAGEIAETGQSAVTMTASDTAASVKKAILQIISTASSDAENHPQKSHTQNNFSDNSGSILSGKYRHFKGKEYEVLYVAKHSETLEDMVVYKALYGDGGIWIRPASMWNELVSKDGKTVKRFEKIED